MADPSLKDTTGENPTNTPTGMLEKASYYYAKALLIFVYLIPEDEEKEKEV